MPFPTGPSFHEFVALDPRHCAGPDLARGDVGYLGQDGVVAVAIQYRLFVIGVYSAFLAGEETGAQQNPLGTKRKSSSKSGELNFEDIPPSAIGCSIPEISQILV
jgi:hypothetical protein